MSAGTVERPGDTGRPRTELGRAPRVLVVDDEASMRDMLRIVLRRDGYEVLVADGARAAAGDPRDARHIDLLLSDIRMPDGSGVDVLRAAKQANRDVVAFMMTAFASTDTAVEAMRLGAVDYFTKPFNVDELRLKIGQHLETRRLKEENVVLKRALNATHEFSNLIGRSPAMLALFQLIETVARTTEHGAHHRRVGHRQGDGGQGHPRQLAAARPAVRGAQLRRRARDAARVGALRPRARRVHRRGRQQEGPGRGGRGRHHLPRRDRRDEPHACRSSCCACCRSAASAAWAAPTRCRPTSGSWPPRTRTCRRWSPAGGSGKTSSTASTSSRCSCRRCASGGRTSRCWPSASCTPLPTQMGKPVTGHLQRGAARCWRPTTGRGTSASCRTSSSGPWRWSRRRSCCPRRCRAHVRQAAPAPAPGRRRLGRWRRRRALPELGEGFDLEARGEEFYRHYLALALARAGGVQVKAAEMLGMSFRSFRYYAKKYGLRGGRRRRATTRASATS